ncbi:unnamed protein product [Sympodiomycopsis kandeliae]
MTTPSKTVASATPRSFFPTPALDHAFAGITAGAVATVCMNPLDLIKTQFQVNTNNVTSKGGFGLVRNGTQIITNMYTALNIIVKTDGWKGLYRGLSPNVVGNSASWGLYFLWYTMIKEHMAQDLAQDGSARLSPGQHLLAASESGALTALLTNPIWVVKTRMFTSKTADLNSPYKTLASSLSHIYRHEGIRGLYRGAGLALFGVSNGAIQFMAYEQLKRSRSDAILKSIPNPTNLSPEGQVKLPNYEYVIISGTSKLLAIIMTYPYQVVRSRIQNTSNIYSSSVTKCIKMTYNMEGYKGFYKGMSANLIRILPATCVTFVVYENVSWFLKGQAKKSEKERD